MLTNFLPILNLIISISLVIGGIFAYRYGFTRTANEVQERVINALQNEISALKDRIEELEKGNTRLNQVIVTIRALLKQRNLYIIIDGDVVSLHDGRASSYSAASPVLQEEHN